LINGFLTKYNGLHDKHMTSRTRGTSSLTPSSTPSWHPPTTASPCPTSTYRSPSSTTSSRRTRHSDTELGGFKFEFFVSY